MITVRLKKSPTILSKVVRDSIQSFDTLATCPIPGCDGYDDCYFVDDCTSHQCDTCGSTWKSYDPYNSIEECFDIKQKVH